MDHNVNINCHFVPQFILKNFGTHLSCFNVRTGEYLMDRNPKKLFSIVNLYPGELENKFTCLMERDFSKLLREKILDKDVISLTRAEVRIVKRFLMMSMIRTPDNSEMIHKMRVRVKNLPASLSESMMNRFSMETESDESDNDYWIRTLNCILDDPECTPKSIITNENATFMAYHFANVIQSGYLGFWDSPFDTDEFMITDIGMTSENEIGWHNDFMLNHKKMDTLSALEDAVEGKDELFVKQIKVTKQSLLFFHENFMMFPISSKRMIVLINPFFKILDVLKKLGVPYPDLNNYTKIEDETLFAPNESKRLMTDPEEEKKPDDIFIYRPVKMSQSDCQYCNALLMDRVHTWLGFNDLEKAKRSVLRYKKENEGHVPRNNYDVLYHIISNFENSKSCQ